MHIVEGYAQVLDNMNAHVHPGNSFPDAEYLKSVIKGGPACYGREALREGVPLEGVWDSCVGWYIRRSAYDVG